MSTLGYLRFPTICGDTLAFVCDDDIWRVWIDGGPAHRLTAGLGEPGYPALSPDGRWIAFVGRDEQHPEVMVMPAEGGPARRMTWLGPDVQVRGWTPEGRIIFVTTHGQPFFRNYRAFTIGLDDALPTLLPYGQVNHLAYGPVVGAQGERAVLIGRNTADPARWKRYRGGTAGHLWIDADGSGTFRRMEELPGNITSPMWLDGRVHFISDAEGTGNLYSCRPDGSGLRRLTDHDGLYVRHATTDGRQIVYQCGGQLWLYAPALVDPAEHTGQGQAADHVLQARHANAAASEDEAELGEHTEHIELGGVGQAHDHNAQHEALGFSRPLHIEVPGHRTQMARRFVDAAEHLQGMAVHPQGHSVALEVRGKPYAMALWEGAVHQHGVPDGVRYRRPQWLADGTTLVAISDEAGEERVVVLAMADAAAGGAAADTRTQADAHIHALSPSDPGPRLLPFDIGRVIDMCAAPRGARIAIANHRNEVLLLDLAAHTCTVIDRSDFGRTDSLAWSPDGAWLAYPRWHNARQCTIRLWSVQSHRAVDVTEPVLRDYAPAFDPAGRYLYFLSIRTFDPVYDAVQFELSFPRAARPYLIALQADAPPPFMPTPRGLGEKPEAAAKTATGDQAAAGNSSGADSTKPGPDTDLSVRVDLDGIARRVVAFPVQEGRYGKLAGLKNKVAWTLLPIAGAHGRGGHPDGPGTLEVFDFDTLKASAREDGVDDFVLSADAATAVVRRGKRLRAIAPANKAEPAAAGAGAEAPSRATGWLDLGRVRVSVDPRAEWRQILREVWRLQRDQFWVADMSGVDWQAALRRYGPLLERISTRGELSDLLWELQGELGTSHAYEMGGDHRKPPQVGLGHLGADLHASTDGYAIAHLVQGDHWDRSADSPLNAVGVQARAGECIVAVNGQPVSRSRPPQSLLVNQADSIVALSLQSPASAMPSATPSASAVTRTVLVRTLADETPARYREWVERNRQWVHMQSDGKVGYFHLPDMQAAGFAEFHRYFAAEADRGGLIVDLRYNRGGHVSQLLLEKLARRRTAYVMTRWSRPQPYPDESPLGPVVALTNEHAGSDGDIFSHGMKQMKIGTLVGKRTWGGVVGIWPRHKLVDGSETTQPEFAFWFRDVGWQVENYGTDPQIDVDNAPQDAMAGHDRQLEAALAEAQRQLHERGELMPEFGARPMLAAPALTPRE